MTSDSSPGGSDNRRPPSARKGRSLDQGDLWADEPVSPPAGRAAETPSPPPAAPKTPTGPVEPEVVAPAPAAATPRAHGRESTRTAAPVAPPPPPVAEDDYEEYEDEAYYDDRPSLLSNPYVLAAIAVLGAVMLAVIVVFFFGRNDDDPQVAGTNPNATRTATPTQEGDDDPNVLGLAARSIAIATVREGPALSHLELGTLPANQDVDIVGRNDDASWFQIVFPTGTDLRGWVPNSALDVPDNVEALVDVTEATPVTRPDPPTATTAPEVEDTPEVTATTEGERADIAVFISSDCTPGSNITVTISNVGDVPLDAAPIEIMVSNDGDLLYSQAFQADIDPGASASHTTGVPARPEEMTVSVVLTSIEDVNAGNNIAGCTVEGSSNNVPPAIQTQLAQ